MGRTSFDCLKVHFWEKYLDVRQTGKESLRLARRKCMTYTRSLSVLGKCEGVAMEWACRKHWGENVQERSVGSECQLVKARRKWKDEMKACYMGR